MSVTVDRPFEQRVTLTVDRANRLLALKAHPGFNDLVALSEQTVSAARAALVDYEGWDRDELLARSIAFRAAVKSHEMLFVRVAQAIQAGIEEAAALKSSADPFSSDAADMADQLRVMVLQQEKESNYDTRTPGSY